MVAVNFIYTLAKWVFLFLVFGLVFIFLFSWLEANFCTMQFQGHFDSMYGAIGDAKKCTLESKSLKVSVPNCVWGAGAYYDAPSGELRVRFNSKFKQVRDGMIGGVAGGVAGYVVAGAAIGSFFPGFGTAIGAGAGVIAGALITFFASDATDFNIVEVSLVEFYDVNFIGFEYTGGELPQNFLGDNTYQVDITKIKEDSKVTVTVENKGPI